MYAGEEFEKDVKDYIAMVDAACKTADEATLKEMEKVKYVTFLSSIGIVL